MHEVCAKEGRRVTEDDFRATEPSVDPQRELRFHPHGGEE
jgi:hypothetical protein